jgi:hypothetical protein
MPAMLRVALVRQHIGFDRRDLLIQKASKKGHRLTTNLLEVMQLEQN